MPAHNIASKLHQSNKIIPDPGASGTIVVQYSGATCNLTSATAESRTLALPTREGVEVTLHMISDTGDITLTVASAYDEAGNTTFTFSEVGQFVKFQSFMTSAGVYFWRKVSDYGIGNLTPAETIVLRTLDDLDSSADEIDSVADRSSRIVNTTVTELSLTVAAHSDRILVVDSAAPITITLPVAAATGAKYTIIINTAATATGHVITCGTLDVLKGFAHFSSTTTDDAHSFLTTATDDNITLNGTTKGGLGGDRIEIIDAKANIYQISAWLVGSGALETGFAAT